MNISLFNFVHGEVVPALFNKIMDHFDKLDQERSKLKMSNPQNETVNQRWAATLNYAFSPLSVSVAPKFTHQNLDSVSLILRPLN